MESTIVVALLGSLALALGAWLAGRPAAEPEPVPVPVRVEIEPRR